MKDKIDAIVSEVLKDSRYKYDVSDRTVWKYIIKIELSEFDYITIKINHIYGTTTTIRIGEFPDTNLKHIEEELKSILNDIADIKPYVNKIKEQLELLFKEE